MKKRISNLTSWVLAAADGAEYELRSVWAEGYITAAHEAGRMDGEEYAAAMSFLASCGKAIFPP